MSNNKRVDQLPSNTGRFLNEEDEAVNIADKIQDIDEIFGKYTTLIDETETEIYVGEAAPGSSQSATAWRIQSIDKTTGSTTWAGGVATFSKKWTLREEYSYS